MSSPAAFAKMYAASDTQLILGVPAKPPALRGKEEQRRERALIFVKNRSKRYRACSDVVEVTGFEPAAFWSRTKRATKLRYTSTWSQHRDSNPRPAHYECAALPTELRWPDINEL